MKKATESLQGRRVYLGGPMRGYPRYNFDAFAAATAELRRRGIEVVSPSEMDEALGFDPDRTLEEQDFDVEDALRRDFDAIATVDAVVFLEGATRSSGCLAEYEVARALDLPIYSFERTHFTPQRWVLRSWTPRDGDRAARYGRTLQVVAIASAAVAASWIAAWSAALYGAVDLAA